MSSWEISGFSGVNNMASVDSLKQPAETKAGNFGECELAKAINYDIDDNFGLVKRSDTQDIFTKQFDEKFTQKLGGVTFTVDGDFLRYSLPFQLEEDSRRNVIPYSSPITLIQEVETGMWVSTTEKIMFHTGRNPAINGGFPVVGEYNFSAIRGTGEKVHASKLGLDSGGYVAIFTTKSGICYGDQSGNLKNVSEGVFSFREFSSGISYIKENNGMVQYQVKMIDNVGDQYNIQSREVAIEIDSI